MSQCLHGSLKRENVFCVTLIFDHRLSRSRDGSFRILTVNGKWQHRIPDHASRLCFSSSQLLLWYRALVIFNHYYLLVSYSYLRLPSFA